MRTTWIPAIALAAVALAPATALAADYPPAQSPGKIQTPRKGKAKTFTVCKAKRCHYRSISAAVRKARGGDTIRIKGGTYREGVKVVGPRYDGLKIVGDVKHPRRVHLDGRRLHGAKAQNGLLINNADGVTVKGLYAQGYRANGIFFVNLDDYSATHLVTNNDGSYGVFAFNTKGGRMAAIESYANNDAGIYIGQTPPQSKPERTIVTGITSYLNSVGFSGTNARYVTITKSRWFNNGTGIVPDAEKSEKYAPASDNVISHNDVFWNNFNLYRGAPFKIPSHGPIGLASFPVGLGVVLLGGQNTVVEDNRIFGNWLAGFAAIQQVTLLGEKDAKLREAAELRGNTIRNNQFGLGGRDLNARDMFYDGTGTRNCFQGNVTTTGNLPADNGTFAPCPAPAKNTPNSAAQSEVFGWALNESPKQPESFEAHWIRHPHAAQKGIKPIIRYRK
jgi:hypothetical protein